jgi:HD superfamily phosphodiesterase
VISGTAPGAGRAGYPAPMPDPDLEARVSALETRMNEVAADASAARHLAAANDRDYAGLAIKVDANRRAINALGVQTADRFDRLEQKVDSGFAKADENFARVQAVLDQQAAGQQRIVDLITGLIERGEDR